jgi:hypothetical protein
MSGNSALKQPRPGCGARASARRHSSRCVSLAGVTTTGATDSVAGAGKYSLQINTEDFDTTVCSGHGTGSVRLPLGGGGVRLEIVGGSSNDMMAKVPGGITQAEGSFDSSPRRRPTTPRRRQAGAAWPSGPRLEVGQAPSATKGPRSTASSKRRHGKPPGSMDTLVAKQAQKRA